MISGPLPIFPFFGVDVLLLPTPNIFFHPLFFSVAGGVGMILGPSGSKVTGGLRATGPGGGGGTDGGGGPGGGGGGGGTGMDIGLER